MIKHPQGFREGGVRGVRERGHLRGRPPVLMHPIVQYLCGFDTKAQYFEGSGANSPKWCHMVPKGLQNESLGLPKCSKVEPSCPQRSPGEPKVPKNVQKGQLGKCPGTRGGPKVAQMPSRPRVSFLNDFARYWVHIVGILI